METPLTDKVRYNPDYTTLIDRYTAMLNLCIALETENKVLKRCFKNVGTSINEFVKKLDIIESVI